MDKEPDYRELIDDLENEVKTVEEDFNDVKDTNASGNLQRKQQKAEKIMTEIHDQIDFLKEQLDRIDEKE